MDFFPFTQAQLLTQIIAFSTDFCCIKERQMTAGEPCYWLGRVLV